jgi:hypothetical protein
VPANWIADGKPGVYVFWTGVLDGGCTVNFVRAGLVRGFKEGECSFIPLSLLDSGIWVTHELLM